MYRSLLETFRTTAFEKAGKFHSLFRSDCATNEENNNATSATHSSNQHDDVETNLSAVQYTPRDDNFNEVVIVTEKSPDSKQRVVDIKNRLRKY